MGDAPETPRRVSVAVLLAPPPEDLGEWLADAAAFDAAGADALWIDPPPDARLDPLALVAALTTLTFRALLVTAAPGFSGDPRARDRTLTTIARLSRGRLALVDERPLSTDAGLGRPGPGVFHRLDGNVFIRGTVGGDPERWARTAAPDGRAGWRAAVADAAQRGIAGLIVPAGPRLLDILRNPDGLDDRRDLQLAQG